MRQLLQSAKRAIQAQLLRGDKFDCPICQRSYSQLTDGTCPGCNARSRHRILWLYLKQLHAANRVDFSGMMLHVAPESSLNKIFRKHFESYLSVDLMPGRAMKTADLTQLRFADDSFDCICCNHVLEHIPDDRKAMAELFRVLKPGGWASLHVPLSGNDRTDEDPSVTDPAEREKRFGQDDHVRVYGWDYYDRLRETGFRVDVILWRDFLSETDASRFAAMDDEVILAWKADA